VVQQIGTPAEVYNRPANTFVARFIGSPGMNLVPGRYGGGAVDLPGGSSFPLPPRLRQALERADLPEGRVILGFRPEAASLRADGPIRGQVYADDLHGPYSMLHLALGDDAPVVHVQAGRDAAYAMDTPVRFDIDPERVRCFHPTGEQAL
jgi:multiple sugar transport system ATP-binding protein